MDHRSRGCGQRDQIKLAGRNQVRQKSVPAAAGAVRRKGDVEYEAILICYSTLYPLVADTPLEMIQPVSIGEAAQATAAMQQGKSAAAARTI